MKNNFGPLFSSQTLLRWIRYDSEDRDLGLELACPMWPSAVTCAMETHSECKALTDVPPSNRAIILNHFLHIGIFLDLLKLNKINKISPVSLFSSMWLSENLKIIYLTGIPFPSDSMDLGHCQGRPSFQKGLFLLTSPWPFLNWVNTVFKEVVVHMYNGILLRH